MPEGIPYCPHSTMTTAANSCAILAGTRTAQTILKVLATRNTRWDFEELCLAVQALLDKNDDTTFMKALVALGCRGEINTVVTAQKELKVWLTPKTENLPEFLLGP